MMEAVEDSRVTAIQVVNAGTAEMHVVSGIPIQTGHSHPQMGRGTALMSVAADTAT